MIKSLHFKPNTALPRFLCACCLCLPLAGCTHPQPPAQTPVKTASLPDNALPVVTTPPLVMPLVPPQPTGFEKLPDEPLCAYTQDCATKLPEDASPKDRAQDFLIGATAEHNREMGIMWRGNTRLKEIALTFDDGPHPEFLPRLLDALRELHVKATFFVVGEKVDEAPDMVARIVQEGHEIANHTYDHINLTEIPLEYIDKELIKCSDAVYRACGVRPRFFRPPGGQFDADVFRAAHKLNLQTILWTDDPADFASPGTEVIESRLIGHVRNGAIILLHSGIEQTLQLLPDFVAQMRRDGFRFVTMSEMAQHRETGLYVSNH